MLLPALVLLLSSCDLIAPEDGRQRAELEHAWRTWQARDIRSYEYVQQRLCYCLLEAVAPVRITVRGSLVADVRYAEDGTAVPLEFSALWGTVDDLFRLIDEAIDLHAESLHVTYDRALGYPTHVSIDYHSGVADDELTITASGLRAIAALAAAG
jgi:hypothetical protein